MKAPEDTLDCMAFTLHFARSSQLFPDSLENVCIYATAQSVINVSGGRPAEIL